MQKKVMIGLGYSGWKYVVDDKIYCEHDNDTKWKNYLLISKNYALRVFPMNHCQKIIACPQILLNTT